MSGHRTMQRIAAPSPMPRYGKLLTVLVFALLMAVGTLANLLNPTLLRAPAADFWDGSWAEAYQRDLDDASPLLGASRTIWGVIDLAVFGQGRPGVLVGSDGWLYSAEEYRVVPDPGAAVAAWVEAIAGVAAFLTERDITLVVALVPAKAATVPEPAPVGLPEAARRRYQTALDALQRRGVAAPDLRNSLAAAAEEAPVFLRTDTHWTPHGAEAAALAVAREVRERALLDGLGERPHATEVVGFEELHGDLTAFLDLGPLAGRIGPAPDALELRRTLPAEATGTDLFAEVRIPVALVGTSYSADDRWNVPGALRDALGADVLQAARTGMGPFEPMRLYLESQAFTTAPPELVVWEIPERYLTLEGFVPNAEALP